MESWRVVAPVALCAVIASVAFAATPATDVGRKKGKKPSRVMMVKEPTISSIVAWNISPYSPRASWTVSVSSPTPTWRVTYGYSRPYPRGRSSPAPAYRKRRRSSPRPSWRPKYSSPRPSYGKGSSYGPGSRVDVMWILGSHSPDPSWSFDGKRVAFFDGVCVTVRKAGGEAERSMRPKGIGASTDGGECRSPRWSHDGKRIVTGHDFHGPAILFDLRTGESRIISPRGDEGLWSVSFTPDDRYIIGRIHQTGVVLVPVDHPDRPLALITDAAKFLGGYFPSVSPDGRHAVRLLGEPGGGSSTLEISAIDLRRPRIGKAADPWSKGMGDYRAIVARRKGDVTTHGAFMDHAWSPGGESMVVVDTSWYGGYSGYGYPEGSLKIVEVRGGRVRDLDVLGRNPTWSPDGRYIAFDRANGVWIIPATGGAARMLFPYGIEPKWSPDGTRLLFQNPWHRSIAVAYVY